MRIRYTLLLAGLAAALVAFAAAKVTTDYDHHADFSRYHTYSWIGVSAGDQLWQSRIQGAVDSSLASKGWTRVASGGDASVAAHGRATERDTLQTFYDGFPGWGWRGWGGMTTATTYVVPEEVGALTVDVFDGATKNLIWRAQATETLSSKPEHNEHKLDEAVQKMFDKFPPRSKG
jgi:hypothetical protein